MKVYVVSEEFSDCECTSFRIIDIYLNKEEAEKRMDEEEEKDKYVYSEQEYHSFDVNEWEVKE